MKHILIIDEMHESILGLLADRKCKVSYEPDITRPGILSRLNNVEGLFVRSKTAVDRELIDAAPNLKFVARAGAGIEKMDLDYLKAKKIAWVNAPEGNRDSLGEHAVGVLLSLLHKLHLADKQVRDRIWDREGNRGLELKGKTVGIFGYGYMGSAFVEKLAGFGCRVMAYDKYKSGFGNDRVQEVDLETLFQETEILSIHVPLTDETKNLFDHAYLSRFKKLFILINTARGGVMSNHTVVDLLQSGRLYGAGLDVLENEKLHKMSPEQQSDFDYLIHSPQVLLTPHVGGWSHESYRRINEVLVEKLIQLHLL